MLPLYLVKCRSRASDRSCIASLGCILNSQLFGHITQHQFQTNSIAGIAKIIHLSSWHKLWVIFNTSQAHLPPYSPGIWPTTADEMQIMQMQIANTNAYLELLVCCHHAYYIFFKCIIWKPNNVLLLKRPFKFHRMIFLYGVGNFVYLKFCKILNTKNYLNWLIFDFKWVIHKNIGGCFQAQCTTLRRQNSLTTLQIIV